MQQPNTNIESSGPEELTELTRRLRVIHDLEAAGSILNWDQSTYMPPGGAPARGRALATLGQLAHEMFTDKEIGRLLERLEARAGEFEADSDAAALIRVTRREYDKAVKVPDTFMAELLAHTSESYQAWTAARPNDDFETVRSHLEKTLELSRQYAEYFPGYDHIADPLIDDSDPGMTVATIRPVFQELREALVPLVDVIAGQDPVDDSFLHKPYPEEQQLAFGGKVIREFGYDFERGRQDKTHHPFMTSFSIGDVRITTRIKENFLGEALFSTLHEAGHALYEQGIAAVYEGTPLATGTSSGVHESQSRLWENRVGRSREFWAHWFGPLQETFPDQLAGVDAGQMYKAVNKVERSLIRTDADELTYNLHVMLRFELECELLEGNLAVKDLPGEWKDRMERDLGIRPKDDKDGALQDVHWFAGPIGGAFQGYTLGNLMGAQFYDAALAAEPGIPAEIGAGKFETLHGWLRENIYRHGKKYAPEVLLQRVTGNGLSVEPLVTYLRRKFGEVYGV